MQQRQQSSEKKTICTLDSTVQLRTKERNLAPPVTNTTSNSSSGHRLMNRPYSCDVEALSINISPTKQPPQSQHHPYFYNHQTTIRQNSTHANGAAGGHGGTLINVGRRLNASYQQLSNLKDAFEEGDYERRRKTSDLKEPPMAVQEDFILDSCERNALVERSNEHLAAASKTTVVPVVRRISIQNPQHKPSAYYVNLPSTPGRSQIQAGQNSQSLDPAVMQRSVSQCDFQHESQTDRVAAHQALTSTSHQRLQCQKSATNSSYYYSQAGSDSNVAFSVRSYSGGSAGIGTSVDQMECFSSNYNQPPIPTRSPTFASIHQNQRRQFSGDALVVVTTCSQTSIRDYGSASSIDRLAASQAALAYSDTSSTASASATASVSASGFQRAQCSSLDVSKQQQQQKQTSLPLRTQKQSFIVSVTSADEAVDGQTRNANERPPLTKTVSHKQCQQQTPRGSLRRGKAVDLAFYSGETQSSTRQSLCNQQSCTTPAASNKEKEKASNSLSAPRKGSSILRKLIGGGSGGSSKSTSAEDNMATGGSSGYRGSSAGLNSGGLSADGPSSSSRSDFSSDSCDFKYEERVRKRIFAHYDCSSICADARALLNGTSRLKDANLNAATGASQASKPYLFMNPTPTNGIQHKPPSQNDTPTSPQSTKDEIAQSTEDRGDGKSNDLVLSCPYFRNECGGEPIRYVSLSRDIYQQLNNNNHGHGRILPIDERLETWHRSATASEASVLENLSNVYLGGRLCAKRQPQLVIEHVDQGAFYYRHCFSGKAHQNYCGIDENLGPLAISVVRDKLEVPDVRRLGLTSPHIYRLIIRLSDLTTFRGAILEESLPSYQSVKESREQQSNQIQSSPAGTPASGGGSGNASGGTGGTSNSNSSGSGKLPVKELLELTIPEMQTSCLRLALPVPRTEELMLKLDEQAVYTRYKVGVLYCGAQQSTEEQMYNNEISSPAFDEFLDMLGQRVRLKGFDKYKGGLDSKGDTTGNSSVYTTYQQFEIMFHVSTLLPFTPQNRQQLSRKRHIGNDIVTVIFQEPDALPFSPHTVRSHFQHIFVVVRAHNPNTDNVRYSVSVSRCKDVPPFGPPIPSGATYPKSKDFRDFLLTKIINAENAVHKSEKFAAMAARTRREFMRDLAENHVTSHTLEGSASGKIASKLLGGRRKDRAKPKLYLDSFCRGALVWDVQVLAQVEDFSLCRPIECSLGISADNLVLIERSTNEALYCTPTLSIIGWTSHGNSLKLYYDHADVIILRTLEDDDSSEMQEIIRRLQAVTKGCETVELILRRNNAGQLGFHIQHEGIVSEVEMFGYAWQAGLRQGSRLVEICKVSVATLTYERMLELLRTSANVRVLVIPPLLEDGSPRRGCEDPYCSAVVGEDSALTTSAATQAIGAALNRVQVPQRPRQSTVCGVSTRPAPPSYEAAVSRRPISSSTIGVGNLGGGHPTQLTQSMTSEQSPELRSIGTTDYGYESGGGNHVSSTKSLDDIQNRRDRRHSEDIRSILAEHAAVNNGPVSARAGCLTASDDRWNPPLLPTGVVQVNGAIVGNGPRTDTLSSSGSTASSEMSSDSTDAAHGALGFSRYKPTRPSELKRRVDKANSDMGQRAPLTSTPILERTVTDPCSSATTNATSDSTPRAPPIPPKLYRAKLAAPSTSSGICSTSSSLSSSTGLLSVPSCQSGTRQLVCSSSAQENLLHLITDLESNGRVEEALIISTALQRTLSDSAATGVTASISSEPIYTQPHGDQRFAPQQGQGQEKNPLSPETERGIEWASLVDAATRAIEGMTRRTSSHNVSPEFTSENLRLEAAAQRIKLLEEKVDRLQTDLDKERESKHALEVEVLHLRDANQRLTEECKNAKSELRRFTEWFFNAVENSNGQQPRPPQGTIAPEASSTTQSIGETVKKFFSSK